MNLEGCRERREAGGRVKAIRSTAYCGRTPRPAGVGGVEHLSSEYSVVITDNTTVGAEGSKLKHIDPSPSISPMVGEPLVNVSTLKRLQQSH